MLRKVLLIDDTLEDRVACRRFLAKDARWHYEYVEAENARQALALVQATPFDCVLLDYALPDADGLALLPHLVGAPDNANVPAVPVVMMTGTGDPTIAVEAMKRGALDYLVKGRFTAEDLQLAVNNAVEKAALLREHRQFVAALQASEARYDALMQASNTVFWRASPQGEWIFGARLWNEFTGQTNEEMTGWGWLAALHPDDREATRLRWQQAQATQTQFQTEFRVRMQDGTYRWFSVGGIPIRNDDGSVREWVGANNDIHERKQAELEREELLARESTARAEAENANRAKDEWLALVSHELRTPLNAMLGYARLLSAHPHDSLPKLVEIINIIKRNGERQNELINDLLDMARLMSGKLHLDIALVDLHTLIDEALATLRPAATARQITLETDLGAVDYLVGDASRLQQVINNLLTNAVKFTPVGGRVTLVLRQTADAVQLSVRDTGEGIAPDFLPYLFDRFSQRDTSRSRRHGGLGLGLALVKHLVELHGGSIKAESAGLGRGATFTVTLPARNAQGRVGSGSASSIEPEEFAAFHNSHSRLLAGLNILVVDDDADALLMLTMVLQSAGAEVQQAASAMQAQALWQRQQFDALVSDIGLPQMDGYELLRRLRELAGGQLACPAVAVTAYANLSERLRALAEGFQMYIAKPIEPEELIAAIASLSGRLGLEAQA
ncbi:MAG TPA: response regulator [Blastocatellia bacterium]|nr:response regulator [Blastocatellia bacterium]